MAFAWSKLSERPVRRLGRLLAVLAIAISAGHLVQTLAARKATAVVVADRVPTKIVQLSAAPEVETALPVVKPLTVKPLPAKHILAPLPETAPVTLRDCKPVLTAAGAAEASVDLSLTAPCDGGARVVLAHGGLTVTGRLAADGTLNLTIPALDEAGRFELRFADGRSVVARHPVPDLAHLRRFAVQWLGLDGFVLHGFENGADFGMPGDVFALQPQGRFAELGDMTVENPLMAQVYTFPAEGVADVVVEARVTAANCSQEMLGQTISSMGGAAQVVDLTLAMPDCSAVGDFLVLKNLAQDMKLATK